jgi:hypothetical protein
MKTIANVIIFSLCASSLIGQSSSSFYLGPNSSEIRDVSANGEVAVGLIQGNVPAVYRVSLDQWDPLREIANPAIVRTKFATASAVSSDGSRIYGRVFNLDGNGSTIREAAIWSGPQWDDLTILGGLPDANFSAALGASADGSKVVGFSGIPTTGNTHVWTWTQDNGFVRLSEVPESAAFIQSIPGTPPISDDGEVIGFDTIPYDEVNPPSTQFGYLKIGEGAPVLVPNPTPGETPSLKLSGVSRTGLFAFGSYNDGFDFNGYLFNTSTQQMEIFPNPFGTMQRDVVAEIDEGRWVLTTDLNWDIGFYGNVIYTPTGRERTLMDYLQESGYSIPTNVNLLGLTGAREHENGVDLILFGLAYGDNDFRGSWMVTLTGGFDPELFPQISFWSDYPFGENGLYRETTQEDWPEAGMGTLFDGAWPYIYVFNLEGWLYVINGTSRRGFTAYYFGGSQPAGYIWCTDWGWYYHYSLNQWFTLNP